MKCMPITWSARAVAPAILVYLVGTRSGAGDLGQRNRRGIARQDRFRFAQLVQLREDIKLERLVLGRRLDHDIDVGQFFQRGRGFDIGQGRFLVFRTDLFLLEESIEAAGDRVQAALDLCLADVLHDHPEPRRGANLDDAVTHGSGANHADCFYAHKLLSLY
jgi:hypothetical protein